MDLSGVQVPEEIVERILEYLPFPSSRRVCRMFDVSSIQVWEREIEKIISDRSHLSHESAEQILIEMRGGEPVYIPPPWTKEDYAHVGPFVIAFSISICLLLHRGLMVILEWVR